MSDSRKPRKASGFIRVEKINRAWWFVDPTGEPFVSLGVNHREGMDRPSGRRM